MRIEVGQRVQGSTGLDSRPVSNCLILHSHIPDADADPSAAMYSRLHRSPLALPVHVTLTRQHTIRSPLLYCVYTIQASTTTRLAQLQAVSTYIIEV